MKKLNFYEPKEWFHPGLTLEEKLEEMSMPISEFAKRAAKPEKTIHDVLNGNSSITKEMAVAFETVTQIPVSFWLNNQRNYDEYIARKQKQEDLKKELDWVNNFDYSTLVKAGFLAPAKTAIEKLNNLLLFFSIASSKSFDQVYCTGKLKTDFRLSEKHNSNIYMEFAWLRKGELQAQELPAPSYNEKMLKDLLPEFKELMKSGDINFFPKLKEICLKAGLKLIYTPSLKGAPINGAARFYRDNPVIQLTGRGKKYEIIWFTFFHELAHILYHGKKDIHIESDFEPVAAKSEKEIKADRFASNQLLDEKSEEAIISFNKFDDDSLEKIAKEFNTHPSIILGRLQKRNLISYKINSKHIISVELN